MVPSIAQLVERWTVEVFVAIHRSLVQIRLEGSLFALVLVIVWGSILTFMALDGQNRSTCSCAILFTLYPVSWNQCEELLYRL